MASMSVMPSTKMLRHSTALMCKPRQQHWSTLSARPSAESQSIPEPWDKTLACVPSTGIAGSGWGLCAAGSKQRSQVSRGKRRWQSFGGARGEALSVAVSNQSALDKGKAVAHGPSMSGVLLTSDRML